MLTILPLYLAPLGAGMLLGVLEAGTTGRPRLDRLRGRLPSATWWWLGATAAIVTLAATVGGVSARPTDVMTDNVLSWLAAALVVAPAVLNPGRASLPQDALRWAPIAWIGVVSYGIYLWHLPILANVADRWPDFSPAENGLRVLVAGVLTLAAATASFYLLEQPLLARARRHAPVPTSVVRVVAPKTTTEAKTVAAGRTQPAKPAERVD